jgi:hypothetical protein
MFLVEQLGEHKLEAQLLGMVDSPSLACHAPSLVSI